MRKKLFRGSLAGVLQLLVNSLLVLISIPVLLRSLGEEGYGAFSLVMILGNLTNVAGFGLNSSLIRYLSAQGKGAASDRDIAVTLLFLAAVSTVLVGAGLAFADRILDFAFHVHQNQLPGVRSLFIWSLAASSLLLVGQTFSAILDALQLIDLTSLAQVLYNAAYWGLVILAATAGAGLAGIGVAAFVAAFLWFMLIAVLAFRKWGPISLKGSRADARDSLKKQLSYGLQVYAAGTIGLFYEPLTRLLISRYIGLPEVGFFDIALKLRSQAWGLVGKIFYPLFPLLSSLHDTKRIRELVHDIGQKMVFAVIPAIIIVLFVAEPLVAVWIGHNVTPIARSVQIILACHLLGVIVLPNYQFLIGKGYAGTAVIIQISNVAANLAVFYLTKDVLGYYAAVLANGTAILTSLGVSLFFQHKYLGSLILDTPRQLLSLLGVAIVGVTVGGAVNLFLVEPWSTMAVQTLFISLASLLFYRWIGSFSVSDIQKYFGHAGPVSSLLVAALCTRNARGR